MATKDKKTSDNHTAAVSDPCQEFGQWQWRGLAWFVGALIAGVLLTFKLATIDRWMYDNNGEMLNTEWLKENRHASTAIASERVDKRTYDELATVEQEASKLNDKLPMKGAGG